MKNYLLLFLILFSSSAFSQAKLEEFKYDKKTNTFLVKVKDKKAYNSLINWTDDMITKKYTGVEGILAYSLNRKIEDMIESEIEATNAKFLLKSYIGLDDENIAEILNKKEN